MVWKMKVGRSEWEDYEGAEDAMVAMKAMRRARVGHCYCGDGYFVGT